MDEKKHQPSNAVRKFLYLPLAGGFLVIGVVGAVLPVLPTTPFLLLASYFLARSSPRLNEALLRSRYLGPILEDWQKRGGIRSDVKVRAILLVTLVVGLTIYFAPLPIPMVGIMGSLALVGILVILRLPEIPRVDAVTAKNTKNKRLAKRPNRSKKNRHQRRDARH